MGIYKIIVYCLRNVNSNENENDRTETKQWFCSLYHYPVATSHPTGRACHEVVAVGIVQVVVTLVVVVTAMATVVSVGRRVAWC